MTFMNDITPAGAEVKSSEYNDDGCGGQDLNLRPLGYEPNELPDCSTPRYALSVGRGP